MRTKNSLFERVTFSSPNGGAISWGGLFYIGELGTENMIVKNCNIDQLPGFPQVKYRREQGGVFIDANNTFY
jgi:hypothetical protein